MKRRLIRQGLSSLTLSLPSKWVRENNLDAGEEVDVVEGDRSLLISLDSAPVCRSIDIDVSSFDQMLLPEGHKLNFIKIAITDAYVQGYDTINLNFKKPCQRECVEEVVKEFIGLVIVEQTKSRVVIRDVSGMKNEESEHLLRRMFLVILSMAEEGVEFMKCKDLENANLVHLKDKTVNQLACYLLRQISKGGSGYNVNALPRYSVILMLAQLGDEYDRLYKVLDCPLNEITIKSLGSAASINRLLYEIFYKFDIQKAAEMEAVRERLRKEIPLFISRSDKHNALVCIRILKIVELAVEIERTILLENCRV